MQEYMFLFRGGAHTEPDAMGKWKAESPAQAQAHMEKWGQWLGDLGKAGKFVGAQPLESNGKVVFANGKTVTDGPFMEGKEIVGGYLIVKAAGYDEAVGLAKGCPIFDFPNGKVEIRAVQEMKM